MAHEMTRLESGCLAIWMMVLAPAVAGQCGLSTTLASNGGQVGCMFDVVAQNPAGIEVVRFTISVDAGPQTIEVYAHTGGGTFQGSETNPAAWSLINTFNVTGNGAGNPTHLPMLTGGGGAINGGVTIPGGATQGFYLTLSGVATMWTTVGTAVGTVAAGNVDMQILEGLHISYPFGGPTTPVSRIWNGSIDYFYPGFIAEWETNSATASLDVDLETGSGCAPLIVTRALFNCPAVSPVPGTLNVSALNNPGATYEVAYNVVQTVPANGGGVTLAQNGQIVNLNLSGGIAFLNGLIGPLLLPLPGPILSIPFGVGVPFNVAIQGIVTNAAFPVGFELTQSTEYHVVSQAAPANIPGPTGDDEVVTFNPTANPTCWLSGPWTIYGSTFTEMHVDSNGRVMAVFDSSDFSPTLFEALSGPPSLGIWTDLSPNIAGCVSVSNPTTGVIDVTWNGVPYFGVAGGSNTFTLEYSDGTGTLSIISDIVAGTAPFRNNLTSTGTASNMWVGMTPGSLLPATDPGIVNGGLGFTVAGVSSAIAGTDMLYDFLDTNTVGAPNLPVSFLGTALRRIDFVPTLVGGTPNYSFSGT